MDANDFGKKVPGSKLMAFGALFMLLGSICFSLVALYVIWLIL